MITPYFQVSQNDEFVFIRMILKYVKISDVDYFIENNNFKFHLKPYFLNLFFSGNIVESNKNKSSYDVNSGLLEIQLEKENHGEVFQNLDLMNRLTEKQKNESNLPKIEEINNNSNFALNNINFENFYALEEAIINEMEPELSKLSLEESTIPLNKSIYSFGFNNMFCDVFVGRDEERIELMDVNPLEVPITKRFVNKMKQESEDFNPQRYFFDLTENKEMIDYYLKYDLSSHFNKIIQKSQIGSLFNEKEQTTLKSLMKLSLPLLHDKINFHLYLQIVDLLFVFLYDYRINDFEDSSESGWNINKLSSVLSFCIDYNGAFWSSSGIMSANFIEESVKFLIISCYRRVLTYSLYRNVSLCEKIKEDVVFVLGKGLHYMLKCLLGIKIIFEKSEPRHILNGIYIDYYCKFIENSNLSIWNILSSLIKDTKITKDDLKLDLEEIEEDFQKMYD